MRNIVNGLLVRHGSVLLARRSLHRTSYGGKWSFPGGHVEPNEAWLEALTRELLEEIAVTPTATVPLGSIADPNAAPSDPVAYHMYAVTAWHGGEPKMRGEEHSELRWFPLQRAGALHDLALPEYQTLFQKLLAA